MIKDNYLIEAFNSLVTIINIVGEDNDLSLFEIEDALHKEYSNRSIKLALNYYVNTILGKKSSFTLFNSFEFVSYGEDINEIILFLISNGIVEYRKVAMVIERLLIINLAEAVTLNDVKRVFSSMIFDESKNSISEFTIN